MALCRRTRELAGTCAAALLCLLGLSACAVLGGGGYYGGVEFVSEPAGAQVVNLKDDTVLGTTPARVWFPGEDKTAEQVTVKFRKAGYQEKITSFWLNRRHGSAEEAMNDAMPVRVELLPQRP